MKILSPKICKFVILTLVFLYHIPLFASDKLTCESRDGRRKYCEVGGARDSDIDISKRLSDSSCERGDSWDRDDRGVWVDHGCRAEFIVYRPEDRYDGRPDSGDREPSRNYGRPQAESCPSGFEPGSHRCSNEERRKGCKDMRMPQGTTCNSRGWSR